MNMVWVLSVQHCDSRRSCWLSLSNKSSGAHSVRIDAKVPGDCRPYQAARGLRPRRLICRSAAHRSRVPSNSRFAPGDELKITFPSNTGSDEIGGQVIGVIGGSLRIAFQLNTIAEQEILTRALYSRANAWIDSAKMKEEDRPLISLGRVMVLSTYGIYQVCRISLSRRRRESAKPAHVKTAAILLAAFAIGVPGRMFAIENPQKDVSGDNELQSASSGQRIPGRAAGRLPDSGLGRTMQTMRDPVLKSLEC